LWILQVLLEFQVVEQRTKRTQFLGVCPHVLSDHSGIYGIAIHQARINRVEECHHARLLTTEPQIRLIEIPNTLSKANFFSCAKNSHAMLKRIDIPRDRLGFSHVKNS